MFMIMFEMLDQVLNLTRSVKNKARNVRFFFHRYYDVIVFPDSIYGMNKE